ncbi:MAG: class I SAM-dependent methyltransferase [Ginsengibacter sp.]
MNNYYRHPIIDPIEKTNYTVHSNETIMQIGRKYFNFETQIRIMDVNLAYDTWASQYDKNKNKTRDLEGQAMRASLENIRFDRVLEIGCGTGKNTIWFVEKAKQITAIDLSDKMLALAKEKIKTGNVQFVRGDITRPWSFGKGLYDLVSFSLVLEHIDNLDHIFRETSKSLQPGGYVYIGELHPFKQYSGTKARFDNEEGQQEVNCFIHNISDFIQSARKCGFRLVDMEEYFDNNDRNEIPRILVIILRKEFVSKNGPDTITG